ncbi:uncharacterized protein LOC143022441 [Oratosquilla oratoria]|uniref:uncharacterized protein LOC143022441 n=1 Tax=Oratosquilla oratoria TaxID=337810 RepID=UPI003F774BCB
MARNTTTEDLLDSILCQDKELLVRQIMDLKSDLKKSHRRVGELVTLLEEEQRDHEHDVDYFQSSAGSYLMGVHGRYLSRIENLETTKKDLIERVLFMQARLNQLLTETPTQETGIQVSFSQETRSSQVEDEPVIKSEKTDENMEVDKNTDSSVFDTRERDASECKNDKKDLEPVEEHVAKVLKTEPGASVKKEVPGTEEAPCPPGDVTDRQSLLRVTEIWKVFFTHATSGVSFYGRSLNQKFKKIEMEKILDFYMKAKKNQLTFIVIGQMGALYQNGVWERVMVERRLLGNVKHTKKKILVHLMDIGSSSWVSASELFALPETAKSAPPLITPFFLSNIIRDQNTCHDLQKERVWLESVLAGKELEAIYVTTNFKKEKVVRIVVDGKNISEEAASRGFGSLIMKKRE